jgi:hypothetical protein
VRGHRLPSRGRLRVLKRKRASIKFIANDEPRRVYGCTWPENSSIRVSQVVKFKGGIIFYYPIFSAAKGVVGPPSGLKRKGGKEKELPVHHKLEELLDQYLKATGLEKEPESPLFPASIGKTGKLSRRPLVRTDAADMLKRRLKQGVDPTSWIASSLFASLIPRDRHHEFSGK